MQLARQAPMSLPLRNVHYRVDIQSECGLWENKIIVAERRRPKPTLRVLYQAVNVSLQHTSTSHRQASAYAVRISKRDAVVRAQSGAQACGVVITGGSKGLGFAMAREFLARGDRIVICGRNDHRLECAVASLQQSFPSGKVAGIRCDVSDPSDVEALSSYAQQQLGNVDFWINNAGEVTCKKLLADVDPSEILKVVGSNVVGSLLCSRQAIRLLREQPSSLQPKYHIFNMGFSSWGASFSKSAVTHKATKTALTQLTLSLAEELKAAGIGSIGVHNLSPGMVLTDLLLKDSSPVARRFFNTLAEEPETVAASLVPRIKAVQGSGTSIDFLSPATAVGRVVSGVPQILFGGRFFDKEGNRVAADAASYTNAGVKLMFDYDPEAY